MENVAALRRRGLDRVLGDLAEIGYDAAWTSVRAAEVGAPHNRERVFVLGYRPEALPMLSAAADTDVPGRSRNQGLAESAGARFAVRRRRPGGHALPATRVDIAASTDPRWGRYAPAIRRWEDVLRRPAPYPIERGTKGQPRIAPAFSEWLMGLPAGFVTDLELPYGAQLKALGNGVVPQQATAGLQRLVDQVPRTGDHISPNDERSNN